ncbi:hypothetical protein OEZ85_000198 [Tetradesmus obliquus]|uniref:RING-type domain-containing protein n=1 Tax=Tetradesmus obliquus TaxID=3088 RepID=A0ABY8UT46_TETOB|nr:hypothetical protein OEZ85_000198 [Tetradesmus obliquus]
MDAEQQEAVFAVGGAPKGHVDQDLLLARVLQEQERAFHELMGGSAGGSYGSHFYAGEAAAGSCDEDGSEQGGQQQQQQQGNEGFDDDEDLEGLDDEALARRLQSEEDQLGLRGQMQRHMQGLAGLGFQFDDADEELDFDSLGYEDLNAIGDVAGKVGKGMQRDAIQQLPQLQVGQLRQQCSSSSGCCGSSPTGRQVQQLAQKALAPASMCTICQCDYEDADMARLLPCGHMYHQECVDQWLGLNKTCPICNKEVPAAPSAAAAAGEADTAVATQ